MIDKNMNGSSLRSQSSITRARYRYDWNEKGYMVHKVDVFECDTATPICGLRKKRYKMEDPEIRGFCLISFILIFDF